MLPFKEPKNHDVIFWEQYYLRAHRGFYDFYRSFPADFRSDIVRWMRGGCEGNRKLQKQPAVEFSTAGTL